MAKKRTSWSEKTYYRYLAEGRGQGSGASYKPWLTVHSFPSNGVVSRIKGRTTGRIHHLLSRNEEYYFLLLDFSPDVLDIREQYPLKLEDTISIARSLDIRHPRYPGCSFPAVMTTDFLITKTDGLYARTVKMAKELDNPRTIEKFLIEQEYWKRQGIDWAIVTEHQINREKAMNLKWLLSPPSFSEMVTDTQVRDQAGDLLIKMYRDPSIPFVLIVNTVEGIFSLPPGSAVSLMKELILERKLPVDLDRKINLSGPRAFP